MKVKDLKPAGYNPRKISKEKLAALKKSLEEFGDLSGIVFNMRTERLIGGHQRTKNLDPSWPIIKEPQTDATGTTAAGYIETPHGRLTYREVDWPEEKGKMANVAAMMGTTREPIRQWIAAAERKINTPITINATLPPETFAQILAGAKPAFSFSLNLEPCALNLLFNSCQEKSRIKIT